VDGQLLPHHTHYFVERAQGGVALIIVGGCTVDDFSGAANMISARDDKFIPGLTELAKAVQTHGAKIAAQLYHAGRYAHSMSMGGRKPVSSSPVRSRFTGETRASCPSRKLNRSNGTLLWLPDGSNVQGLMPWRSSLQPGTSSASFYRRS